MRVIDYITVDGIQGLVEIRVQRRDAKHYIPDEYMAVPVDDPRLPDMRVDVYTCFSSDEAAVTNLKNHLTASHFIVKE